MKNKKKTKKMKIENKKTKIERIAKTIMQISILTLINVIFLITFINIANIYEENKIQTKTLIQISDFLQNRFEIEKPSPQMVELRELKGN